MSYLININVYTITYAPHGCHFLRTLYLHVNVGAATEEIMKLQTVTDTPLLYLWQLLLELVPSQVPFLSLT